MGDLVDEDGGRGLVGVPNLENRWGRVRVGTVGPVVIRLFPGRRLIACVFGVSRYGAGVPCSALNIPSHRVKRMPCPRRHGVDPENIPAFRSVCWTAVHPKACLFGIMQDSEMGGHNRGEERIRGID